MANGEITSGELFRTTEGLRQSLLRIEGKLDVLVPLPAKFDAHVEEDDRRIGALEDSKTWVLRGIGGAAIGALFAILLTVVKI